MLRCPSWPSVASLQRPPGAAACPPCQTTVGPDPGVLCRDWCCSAWLSAPSPEVVTAPPPHLLARCHLLCHSVESHCYLSFHAPGHVRGQLSSSASPCCLSCISASALAPLLGGQDPPWGRGAPSATSLSHCFQLSPALWMHGSVCVVEFPQYQAFMCEKYSPYKARCTDRLG